MLFNYLSIVKKTLSSSSSSSLLLTTKKNKAFSLSSVSAAVNDAAATTKKAKHVKKNKPNSSFLLPLSLPALPYDYAALEPVLSRDIMTIHHTKHHAAYVTNFNVALEKYNEALKIGNVSDMIALQSAMKFNGGGHLNHALFWDNLAPPKGIDGNGVNGGNGHGGGDPKDVCTVLSSALDHTFGTFQDFKRQFAAQTAAVQGSGWGWLVLDPVTKCLRIVTCANQDPVSTIDGHGKCIPLLGIDVWEHAYYLQYMNARPAYLTAIWDVINWTTVAKRYEDALTTMKSM